jgi:type IV fimbrial biogenesis protein FimT
MQVLSCQRAVSLVASPGQTRAQRGFTLVELMITLTIAVVLLMIAVPSFKNLTLSNKLTTSANDIVHAISVARMEAIKRNSSTQLCSDSSSANSSTDLGKACGTETGAVWAMSGAGVSQVLAGAPGLVAPLQLKGNATALNFTAQGLARKVGTTTLYEGTVVDICTSQMTSSNHRVITMTAGSILATTTTSGTCP